MKTGLGALLVGGTALGAGMLALPVATAGAGIMAAWSIYLACWAFSVATGFLFIEIAMSMPKNANIVSMARKYLGKWGEWSAWVLYIFLFYCLTIAYISGGGRLLMHLLPEAWGRFGSTLFFTLFFGLFVYMGTKMVSRINSLLMVGLIVSYAAFVVLGLSHVSLFNAEGWGWGAAVWGLPVIFTSFSYQGIIPSLLHYLDRDPKKMKLAIFWGTSIPFVAYLLWDLIIKGIIPVHGVHGLLAARAAGVSAVEPLRYVLHSQVVANVADLFAFFALTTSFVGVALGLLDFLMDSLKVAETEINRLWLALLIFLPSFVIAFVNPSIFLDALGYAGGFGCALLLGLFPILMVWNLRYKMGHKAKMLWGGKSMLALLLLFVVGEVVIQIFQS